MNRTRHILDFRVTAFLLIFAAGILAAPSQASGDRPVAAIAKAEVSPAGKEISPDGGAAASPFDEAGWDDAVIGSIESSVFSRALASAESAVNRGEADVSTLTVIDFSRPSTERRLWVYDLRSKELLFEEHVSHGRNSGHNLPTLFSNEPESHKSSLGLFRAAEGYYGQHGYSLRLDGLEPGFNDRARERAIVIHGAAYVNAETANAQGRLGRSLGCPAVRPGVAGRLIDAVKEGGLVFAYYPDPAWLDASTYLN
jgi:hypothetical protein